MSTASADGIDDNVELHLIDTSKLIEESRKIHKARDLKKQADSEVKKLTQSVSPLANLTKDDIVKNILGMPIGTKGTPKGFFTGGNQTFKNAVSGARTDSSFNDLKNKLEEQQKDLDDLKKQQEDTAKKQAQLEKETQDARDAADKKQLQTNEDLVGGAKDALGGIVDPSTIPAVALMYLKKFGIIGAIIGSAISYVIGPLQQQFQAQFGRGGALDTKLKVPRQALTVNNIEDANSWNDGTKYITSDLRIVQKAPQSSNTLKISHEAVRYVLDDLGKFS